MTQKEKNIANAKGVFAKTNIPALYFTNDGQAFYKEGPAKVHQREIGGAKEQIHTVKNGAYTGAVESVVDVVTVEEKTTVDGPQTIEEVSEEAVPVVTEKKSNKKKEAK